MKQIKLFSVVDNEKGINVGYFEATSAHKVIRDNWRYFKKLNAHFHEDWTIHEILDISNVGLPVENSQKNVEHSWDEYDIKEEEAKVMSDEEKQRLINQR